jgi:hypothetical protein
VRRGRAVWRSAGLAALLVGLVSGCGLTHLQDLRFRVDDRLHFTSPPDRSLVRQPFTVSWTIDDFRIAAEGSEPPSRDAGYFAVFVDKAPVKPGQTLDVVANDDPACQADPGCPDKSDLRDRRVYPTTNTHLRLNLIPDVAGRDEVQLHVVTVVLMDTAGHRIGESAWELDVRMHRVGLS